VPAWPGGPSASGATVGAGCPCPAAAQVDLQSGTPLFALQEMGGWESAEMVRRYAHLAADHLAPWADRLVALRTVEPRIYGTFTAQS
jgi:hypothetical protein